MLARPLTLDPPAPRFPRPDPRRVPSATARRSGRLLSAAVPVLRPSEAARGAPGRKAKPPARSARPGQPGSSPLGPRPGRRRTETPTERRSHHDQQDHRHPLRQPRRRPGAPHDSRQGGHQALLRRDPRRRRRAHLHHVRSRGAGTSRSPSPRRTPRARRSPAGSAARTGRASRPSSGRAISSRSPGTSGSASTRRTARRRRPRTSSSRASRSSAGSPHPRSRRPDGHPAFTEAAPDGAASSLFLRSLQDSHAALPRPVTSGCGWGPP